MAFLAAKNENLQLEDLSQADFGRVSEKISSIGKEKVNNWEFHLKPYHRRTLQLFSFINEVDSSY